MHTLIQCITSLKTLVGSSTHRARPPPRSRLRHALHLFSPGSFNEEPSSTAQIPVVLGMKWRSPLLVRTSSVTVSGPSYPKERMLARAMREADSIPLSVYVVFPHRIQLHQTFRFFGPCSEIAKISDIQIHTDMSVSLLDPLSPITKHASCTHTPQDSVSVPSTLPVDPAT